MSTPWIDLSAHNLALWRIGPDQDGLRLYVLHPIISDMPHEIADLRTSAGQAFLWDADQQAYTLHLRVGQEKLPALGAWLKAYPGALQRDRDQCTFNTHRPSLLDLRTLALANPWAWSNIENPERCFANEEQALADGGPGAVLRAGVEVDPRMVRLPHAVAPLDAEKLPQEPSAPEEDGEPEDPALSPEQAADGAPEAAEGDQESGNTDSPEAADGGPEPGMREDYGDRIEGARKHAFDTWASNLRAQQVASQEGSATPGTLKQMAAQTRKDTLIGAKQQMADRLKDSPILASLWEVVNAEIPASVASTPMKKRRGSDMDADVAMRRIVGYAEVVSAIGRKFDALHKNLTEETLTQAIFGDTMEALPHAHRWRPIIPKDAYDGEHPLLSNRAASDEMGSGVRPLREALDGTPYSLAVLLSEVTGEPVSKVRNKLMHKVMDTGFSFLQKRGDPSDLSTEFLLESETVARICSSMKFLGMKSKNLNIDSISGFIFSDEYFVNRGIAKDALKNMNEGERQSIMQDYFQHRADRIARELLSGLKKIPYTDTDNYHDLKTILTLTDVYQAVEEKFDKEPDYREFKEAEKRFLTTLMGSVMRHYARTAEAASQQSNENDEHSDPITPENPADAKPKEAEKFEPEFFKFDKDKLPALPNESKGNSYRSGTATDRGDRDVTEKELCDRFGFRGVQYGNWMTQKDRTEHLNAAFDSCCDVQDLMGFEDAAMVGLPRKRAGGDRQALAIALGARGRGGRVAAHYEPDLHVINLTKTNGAGSLLHEWTHAADGFMGAERTGGQNILESNLAPRSWKETPFAMLAKTLQDGMPTKTKEDRYAVMLAFMRTTHDLMKSNLRQTFLGESAQKYIFYHINRDLMRQWLDTNKDAGVEERSAAQRTLLSQSIRIFESYLPRMVDWVSREVSHLDAAIEEAGKRKDIHPLNGIREVLSSHFSDPYFSVSGLNARWRTDNVLNRLQEAIQSPSSGNPGVESEYRMMATAWADAIRRDAWKKMAGPIINKKTVYDKTLDKNSPLYSQFYAEAQVLGEYWERPHELVARAVAAIGYDTLDTRGIKNTYLTASAPRRFSDPLLYRADSEPQGPERAFFSETFANECLPVLRNTLHEALRPAHSKEEGDDCAVSATV